jgi:hypothetical protein
MVIPNSYLLLAAEAEEKSRTVLEQLDPERRVAVIMALVALVLIGMFFIIAIPLGGRYVRRSGQRSRPDRSPDSGPSQKSKANRQQTTPSRRAVTTDTLDAHESDETRVTDYE